MNRLQYWIARARPGLISIFNPWGANKLLREENARLVGVISDPLLTGISIGNGSIYMGLSGGPAQLMAGMFVGMFEKYPDAKNYIEVTFGSPIGGIVVTAQKMNGLTPDQKFKAAQQELEELRKRISAQA